MIGRFIVIGSLLLISTVGRGQMIPGQKQDTTINNLILPPGYKTSIYGAIPPFRKEGRGKSTLILIPGLGFDGSVFNDFANANRSKYTLYILTVPGFGTTPAPPIPAPGTSYGDQTWNRGVLMGIAKLIDQEKINHAVVVGSFVQGTQLALRMAIDYPDKVSKVIVIGGAARFVYINKGVPTQFPLPGMIAYTDKVTRNQWFKHMPAKDFNDGNYLPVIYSLDSIRGNALWNQPASVPTSVMVQYLCEFFASDVTLELDKIKCPVLVLRPAFSPAVLAEVINNYVKPQFIDAWNGAESKNPLIKIVDVHHASAFVWKDNPKACYAAIDLFLK